MININNLDAINVHGWNKALIDEDPVLMIYDASYTMADKDIDKQRLFSVLDWKETLHYFLMLHDQQDYLAHAIYNHAHFYSIISN